MFSVLSGLLSAASWGTGDFLGGLTSKRSAPLPVAITTGAMGGLMMLAMAILLREPLPSAANAGWAAAAGVAGAFGLLMLYTGLATGTMGIVAPITGVVGAAIPILFSALTNGAPSVAQGAGFLMALAAVWLLSGGMLHRIELSKVAMPLGAGLGFGVYFVLLAQVAEGSLFASLTVQRFAAFVALLVWGLLRGQAMRPPRAIVPATLIIALFDTGGNVFYLISAQSGRMDIAAVLSSLYPAMTVLLASVVLKEHLTRPQWAGVAAAVVAIPLIVA